MKAFERFNELMRSDSEVKNLLKLDNSIVSNMIKSHIIHIEDPHFKVPFNQVKMACLTSLGQFLETSSDKFQDSLQLLVSNLVPNLVHSKEAVASLALKLLDQVRVLYHADDLLPCIMKLNSNQPKLKLMVLEIMGSLAEYSHFYLSNQLQITAYIKKVLNMIKDSVRNKQLVEAANRAIEGARVVNSSGAANCILELPGTEKQLIKTLLSQTNSTQLEENIQALIKNRYEDVIEEVESEAESEEEAPLLNEQLVLIFTQLREDDYLKLDAYKSLREYLNTNMLDKKTLGYVLKVIYEGFEHESMAIREASIQCLSKLVGCYHLATYLKEVLLKVSHIYAWDESKLISEMDSCLDRILLRQDPNFVIPMICSLFTVLQSPCLQAYIGHLGNLVQVTNSIKAFIPKIMTTLHPVRFIQLLSDVHPEVRKSALLTMVEMQIVMGDEFEFYLQKLSEAHQKLLAIYVKKRLDS
jgi:hypothetical protein